MTYSLTNTRFTVETPKGEVEIDSRLIGQFNVYGHVGCRRSKLCFERARWTRTIGTGA